MLTLAILMFLTGLALYIVQDDFGENAFAFFCLFEIVLVLAESWMLDFTLYPNIFATVYLFFTLLGMLLVQSCFKPIQATGSTIAKKQ